MCGILHTRRELFRRCSIRQPHHFRLKKEIRSIRYVGAFGGQKGARCHGNAGIPGVAGNVVCVTYRIISSIRLCRTTSAPTRGHSRRAARHRLARCLHRRGELAVLALELGCLQSAMGNHDWCRQFVEKALPFGAGTSDLSKGFSAFFNHNFKTFSRRWSFTVGHGEDGHVGRRLLARRSGFDAGRIVDCRDGV